MSALARACDGDAAKASAYSAFCSSTSVKSAVGFRQLWQSLPIAPKLLVSVVVVILSLWVANSASFTNALVDCNGKGRLCLMEHRQITITTLVAQLLYAALVMDAVYEENSFQLLTSSVLSIASCLLWLVFVTAVKLSSTAWRVGLFMGFTTTSTILCWLAYRTHQQFGWRVHSALACDVRRKHAADKQHCYFAISRFRTLLKLTTVAVLLNAASALAVALGFTSTETTAMIDSNASHLALSGLLTVVGLHCLPLLWLAVTYFAVRFNSSKLELLSTKTVLFLLVLPVLVLYWTFNPMYQWPGTVAVRVLLLAMPVSVWVVLHCLTWRKMKHVLRLFRAPQVKELIADMIHQRDLSDQHEDVPEQLQPLLRGAWLLKVQLQLAGNAAGVSAADTVRSGSKLSTLGPEKKQPHHPRVSSSTWAIPVFNSFRKAPSSNAARSWLQWQQSAPCIACSSKTWRFFQLSTDLTTLRWSWNKYILLYYVDSLEADADRLTITLHMALDPDLTLAFTDPRAFDQWESALQLVLLMLTGVAPGTARTAAHSINRSAGAAEASAACSKDSLPGLMGVESCSSGSVPFTGLCVSNPVGGMAGVALKVPQPVTQHSLVKTALTVQQLKAGQLGRRHGGAVADGGGGLEGAFLAGAAKLRRSTSSFFSASRRQSVTDPHAVQLQQAQALAEAVSRQLSINVPSQAGPTAGSYTNFLPAGPLQWQQVTEHQQQEEWRRMQHSPAQEHQWWLQQELESSTADMPNACEVKPAAANAAGIPPAAEAGQITAAAPTALACQPHQLRNHSQQNMGGLQQVPAAAEQELEQQHAAADPLHSSRSATPDQQSSNTSPAAMGSGFGPFRTPPGLLRHMQLSGQDIQQHSRLYNQISSSDDSSAAQLELRALNTDIVTNSSDSAVTGTSHTNSLLNPQHLQCQGSFSSGAASPCWPQGSAARASSPSRLQQQVPAQAVWQPVVPVEHHHAPDNQQQQALAPDVHEGDGQHAGLMQCSSNERSGCSSSPEVSVRSRSALMMRRSITPDATSPAAGRNDSRQGLAASGDDVGWQQQPNRLLPVRQFYEQQYSQPPSPNIYGVYTSAALTRRAESPILQPTTHENSSLLRANSMPAVRRSWYGESPLDAARTSARQYACVGRDHVHHHGAGPAVRASTLNLATTAAVFDPAAAKLCQQVHIAISAGSLQPVEHSKSSAPIISKPPAMEDMVDSAGAIPAVWSLNQECTAAVTEHEQQYPWHAARAPVAVPSDRATAGGSEVCLETPGGRSQTSPEELEFLQLPALVNRHLAEAAVRGMDSAPSGSSNSNADVHQQQYPSRSVGTDAHAAQQIQSLQQGNSPFCQGQNQVLVRFDSGQATLGSDSTSRAVSLLQAGLPPFDADIAQVEGRVWQETETDWTAASTAPLPTATEPAVRHSIASAASTGSVPPCAATTAAAVVVVRPSDTAESQQRQQQNSSSGGGVGGGGGGGGSAWRTSLHGIAATIAKAVSGRGTASPDSLNGQTGTATSHTCTFPQSPAPIGRLQMSPFYTAANTAAAAAIDGPCLPPPSRAASAAAKRSDRVATGISRSFTPAGAISFGRELSVAEVSGKDSNTDNMLASSGGPGRVSVGSLTAGGWSDWGRSTMRSTLTDGQSSTDSVIDMSRDCGLIDGQLAGGTAADVRVAGTGKTTLVRSSGSFNMFSTSKKTCSACKQHDAVTDSAPQTSTSNARQHINESAYMATAAAASCSSGWQGAGQQPNQTLAHQMAGCGTSGLQNCSQSTNAWSASASRCKSAQVASTSSASSTSARCDSTGHMGVAQVPSTHAIMSMPALPEAPAAAELDSPGAVDTLDEQQQQQELNDSDSRRDGRPVALGEVKHEQSQQQMPKVQEIQLRSSDKQDAASLCTFTFAVSSHQEQPLQQLQQQPVTLQAAYQLASSVAAGAMVAEVPSAADPWLGEACQPGSTLGQRLGSMHVMQPDYASSGESSSLRIGAARPATLRVSVSDAATATARLSDIETAAAASTAVGSLTAWPHSPRIKSYPSMDNPKGVGRLHVRVPDARRQPGQLSNHHPPVAHHGTHHGSVGVHLQQLAHHDDGYVINSPGSLGSFNSHVSGYTDGSPRTGRIFRQSVGSAGFGGSLQLTNSLCMAYSGWSSRSGGSCRSATTFRQGQAPQVSVELIDWHSLQVGRTIGRGAEGCVFEARYQDAPVAVKEGPSMNEIDMYLAAGVHDNLVGLRGLCQRDDGTWCLLLEYCSRGTLDTLLHHSRSPLPRAAHQRTSSTGRKGSSNGKAAAATGEVIQHQQHQQPQQSRQDLPKLLPYMRGIARGLLHLHSRKPAILHRDIKPANIFIGHGMVMKIGDFGMSRLVHPVAADAQDSNPAAAGTSRGGSANATRGGGSDNGPPHWLRSSLAGGRDSSGNGVAYPAGATKQHQAAKHPAGHLPNRTLTPGVVGTLCYTAPELLDEQLQGPVADADSMLKADVFSFGVTLWEMVERRRPFEGMDGMHICALWIADPERMALPPLSVGDDASDGDKRVLAALQDLIKDCTALMPGQRPSVKQVLTRIKHIQRLYDPRAATARNSKGGDAGDTASGQRSIIAASQQAHDCALCPAASISDSKEHAGQQQLQLPPSEQGHHISDAAVQLQAGQRHLLGLKPPISQGPPAPGVTDPAVAAAIAAAAHTPAVKLDPCADSNSDHAVVGTQQRLPGQLAVTGTVMSYRRSTSESGAAYRGRLSLLHASNGLAHSSSLPSGQSIVLPDLRHMSTEAERRLSGAGLHYRHVR